MLIFPFFAELWLECLVILLIWLVLPVILVAWRKVGAAAVISVVGSIIWIAVSVVLFNESGRERWAMRDGQTWVSLLWLTSAVGALGSVALSSVLLIVRKYMQMNRIKVTE